MTELALIESPLDESVDSLIVGLGAECILSPTLSEFNQRTDGWIEKLASKGQLRGKSGEITILASPLPKGPTMLVVVGLGEQDKSSDDSPSSTVERVDAFNCVSAAIRKLSDRPRETVAIALGESLPSEDADSVVSGAIFACEGEAIYQAEPKLQAPSKIAFSNIDQATLRRGQAIGEAINRTRRLVNEPAAMIYPESFADAAKEMASETGLGIEVWDEAKLEEENCRSILAVGAGSARPPRLVMMRYNGGGDEPPIALVGKGVTFDSGGLSLKPSDAMVDMKCDMGGAATVFGVMQAIAKLGVKQNVIGLCGLAENMVSGTSYKLGDVIETRSGKTIEILNTDAEGRVVLADTLDVAVEQSPRSMVDLATLTGACMVALGQEVAGLMSNDDALCRTVADAAKVEGEPVWQLPMFELYDEKIKSKVADIRNIGEGRWGGAITAAKFLEQFVCDCPWVHIDIAGPAFADSPKPHRDAGATGVMVRTLIRWIESQQ